MNPRTTIFNSNNNINRGLPGRGPKRLKARIAKLGSVWTCLLSQPQRKHPGGAPSEFFCLLGSQMMHSSAILGHCAPIPLPPPLQINFLSRFTLTPRMVLGVGKKSEIRLKSENFDPWITDSRYFIGPEFYRYRYFKKCRYIG